MDRDQKPKMEYRKKKPEEPEIPQPVRPPQTAEKRQPRNNAQNRRGRGFGSPNRHPGRSHGSPNRQGPRPGRSDNNRRNSRGRGGRQAGRGRGRGRGFGHSQRDDRSAGPSSYRGPIGGPHRSPSGPRPQSNRQRQRRSNNKSPGPMTSPDMKGRQYQRGSPASKGQQGPPQRNRRPERRQQQNRRQRQNDHRQHPSDHRQQPSDRDRNWRDRPQRQRRQRNQRRDQRPRREKKNYFEEYKTPLDIEEGIKACELFEGNIRINQRNTRMAYVGIEGFKHDVFVDGWNDRNRAFDGDLVVIQLYEKEKWKKLSEKRLATLEIQEERAVELGELGLGDDEVMDEEGLSGSEDLEGGSEESEDDSEGSDMSDDEEIVFTPLQEPDQQDGHEVHDLDLDPLRLDDASEDDDLPPLVPVFFVSAGSDSPVDAGSPMEPEPPNVGSQLNNEPVGASIDVASPEYPADAESPANAEFPVDDASPEPPGDTASTGSSADERVVEASNLMKRYSLSNEIAGKEAQLAVKAEELNDAFSKDNYELCGEIQTEINQLRTDVDRLKVLSPDEFKEQMDERNDVTDDYGFVGEGDPVLWQALHEGKLLRYYDKLVDEQWTLERLKVAFSDPDFRRDDFFEEIGIVEDNQDLFIVALMTSNVDASNVPTPVKAPKFQKVVQGGNNKEKEEKKERTKTRGDPFKEDKLQAVGKVIFISDTSKRCNSHPGYLKVKKERKLEGQILDHEHIYFVPFDKKVPWGIMLGRDCPKDFRKDPADPYETNRIYEVTYKPWQRTDYRPFCKSKKVIGMAGEIETESVALLHQHNITHNESFPIEVEEQMGKYDGWTIPPEEIEKRRDLRFSHRIFSIDPPNARDLDDALSIVPQPDGSFELGVHIADVTHFFKYKSPVDTEALHRATSVYLVQKVIPMLPRLLCEQLCSLNPNVDRLAFSVFCNISADGKVDEDQKLWFGRTVIRSCAKLDYETVQEMIDGNITSGSQIPEERRPTPDCEHTGDDVIEDCIQLNRLATLMRNDRFDGGALALNKTRLYFELDDNELPASYSPYHRRESNKLVEEFMLLANRLVAKQLVIFAEDIAFLRRHPPPLPHKSIETEELMKKNGYRIDTKTAGTLYNSIQSVEGVSENGIDLKRIVEHIMTKPMRPAQYFCTGNSPKPGSWRHYALNFATYTHFTSPIRRYADCCVHRTLTYVLEVEKYREQLRESRKQKGGDEDEEKEPIKAPISGYDSRTVGQIADHCNKRKMEAKRASEQSELVFLCLLVKGKNIRVPAVISDIGPRSFEVLAPDYSVEQRVSVDGHDEIEYYSSAGDPPDNVITIWWKDGKIQIVKMFSSVTVELGMKEQTPIDVTLKLVNDGRDPTEDELKEQEEREVKRKDEQEAREAKRVEQNDAKGAKRMEELMRRQEEENEREQRRRHDEDERQEKRKQQQEENRKRRRKQKQQKVYVEKEENALNSGD